MDKLKIHSPNLTEANIEKGRHHIAYRCPRRRNM